MSNTAATFRAKHCPRWLAVILATLFLPVPYLVVAECAGAKKRWLEWVK